MNTTTHHGTPARLASVAPVPFRTYATPVGPVRLVRASTVRPGMIVVPWHNRLGIEPRRAYVAGAIESESYAPGRWAHYVRDESATGNVTRMYGPDDIVGIVTD